jgi:hypothetical protein
MSEHFTVENKLVTTTLGTELHIGQMYKCEIPEKNGVKYTVILKNIEFKNKKFFSVTVDLISDSGIEHDVYFYNLLRLNERKQRFPLHKSTTQNNIDFWKTLLPIDLESTRNYTESLYLRNAVSRTRKQKPEKECIRNINKTGKNYKDLFDQLDKLKNDETWQFPVYIALPSSDKKKVIVHRITRNTPMEMLHELEVGKIVNSEFEITEIKDYSMKVTNSRNEEKEIEYSDQEFWSDVRQIDSKKRKSRTPSSNPKNGCVIC